MLQRLHVHNFRGLDNFEFKLSDASSALLIGKNGAGKSNIARVLKLLQSIGRGVNRLGQLVKASDCTLGRTDKPILLELEVLLRGKVFVYKLALELPERFREFRLLEERLQVDNEVAYSRSLAHVELPRTVPEKSITKFNIDWHLVALPVIQDQGAADPLAIFRQWLSRMVILHPIPKMVLGDSHRESLEPAEDGTNVADWLNGLLAQYPAAYATIIEYLKLVIPDIDGFRNIPSGRDTKSLLVKFIDDKQTAELSFDELSEGEKCAFLCAILLAANEAYGPIFAFWDEPDNFLSLAEVAHFVMQLRRSFERSGQIVMTSHNEETIRNFSVDNTIWLHRKSHLGTTSARLVREISSLGSTTDIVGSLMRNDFEI